jgi:hypothetical protein
MLGSFSQIQASTVRQLRSGIAKAIGPTALIGKDADASSETIDQDDSQFINATENNGGNYFLDLFLEALVIDDTSDLTEGKESTDSNVEIVFEEPVNSTTAVLSALLLNSSDYKIIDEIDIITSDMEEQRSNADQEVPGVETDRRSSGPDLAPEVKPSAAVVLKPEDKPAVTIHARP